MKRLSIFSPRWWHAHCHSRKRPVGDFVEVVGDITKFYEKYETMGNGTATIQVIKNPSSALGYSTVDGVVVEKIVRDGQVLIVRDGKAYNTMGQEITE